MVTFPLSMTKLAGLISLSVRDPRVAVNSESPMRIASSVEVRLPSAARSKACACAEAVKFVRSSPPSAASRTCEKVCPATLRELASTTPSMTGAR